MFRPLIAEEWAPAACHAEVSAGGDSGGAGDAAGGGGGDLGGDPSASVGTGASSGAALKGELAMASFGRAGRSRRCRRGFALQADAEAVGEAAERLATQLAEAEAAAAAAAAARDRAVGECLSVREEMELLRADVDATLAATHRACQQLRATAAAAEARALQAEARAEVGTDTPLPLTPRESAAQRAGLVSGKSMQLAGHANPLYDGTPEEPRVLTDEPLRRVRESHHAEGGAAEVEEDRERWEAEVARLRAELAEVSRRLRESHDASDEAAARRPERDAQLAAAVAEAEAARDQAMDEVSSLQRALQQAEEKTARVRTPRCPLVFCSPICRLVYSVGTSQITEIGFRPHVVYTRCTRALK
jgi:hypothetical protein